jgi:predicted DCC family thiol-disulfide oxidoreductase YuxK
MHEPPVLIYDGDCGFCTRSARLIERLPVRVRLVPWQEADLATLRTTEARARQEVIWVDPARRVFGGAAAIAEVFKHCRFPWPLLGRAMSAPLMRILADRTYRWVADNRYRLPGSTPACRLPEDQRPGYRAGS